MNVPLLTNNEMFDLIFELSCPVLLSFVEDLFDGGLRAFQF